jgi:hypothetical protein
MQNGACLSTFLFPPSTYIHTVVLPSEKPPIYAKTTRDF